MYLNRILIPYCNLTFSSHDHIQLTNKEFSDLLTKPKEFINYWKKKERKKRKKKEDRQGELGLSVQREEKELMMTLPQVLDAEKLETDEKRRLFIGAYGFEKRSFGGWVNYQNKGVLSYALVFKYEHPKGRNRIKELRMALKRLGVALPVNVCYDTIAPHNIEDKIYAKLIELLSKTDEVILDISGMTKLLILICICKLEEFHGTVRIVYSEPNNYPPQKRIMKK